MARKKKKSMTQIGVKAVKKSAKVAKENIKKAQDVWKGMSQRARSLAQLEGRSRQKPGTTGRGDFFRIVVRPKDEFVTFCVQQVGRSGHTERLAGKRSSGSWDTQAWLINKEDAHTEDGRLVIDSPKVKTVMRQIRGPILKKRGDIFEAKPRRNVPEREKPTAAQRCVQIANIRKARTARRKTAR